MLWCVYGASGGDEVVGARQRLARVASFSFAASISWTVFECLLFVADLIEGPAPETPPAPLFGALLGWIVYLHGRVLLLDLSRWSYLWAVRAPERLDRTWRMEATSIAWGMVAWPCIGALVMSLALLFESLSYLLVPFIVAIPVFYETWMHPWLQYWRSRRLGDTTHGELEDWLADLARQHRVPRFRVRVHNGLENNAFAMGGLFRHLIVLGGGLVEGMTTRQLQAVLAHEMAHVIRRDVLKLVTAVLAGGTVFLMLRMEFLLPSIDRSTTAGFLATIAYAAFGVPLCYVVGPGLLSRRLEYGADRLAVRLLGGGAPLVDALTRLHELRGEPLEKKSLTHPTGTQRIAAIRRLAAAPASA